MEDSEGGSGDEIVGSAFISLLTCIAATAMAHISAAAAGMPYTTGF